MSITLHLRNKITLFLNESYILQFNPDVYILLRGLDKEQLTNVFLGEALVDLTALLSEDLALFWYLCLPVLHSLWTRYHHVIV